MNDKEANAQIRRVCRYYEKWWKLLQLKGWELVHQWHREPWSDDEGRTHAVGAKTSVYWHYQRVHIDWYLPTLVTQDDVDLEDTVIHELVHILVAEMNEKGEDGWKHEERVVTRLSWILFELERSKHNGKKEAKQGQAAHA